MVLGFEMLDSSLRRKYIKQLQPPLQTLKRLRYFMQRDGAVLNMVLRIFLRGSAQSLQSNCSSAPSVDMAALHIGAVALIHRFSSSLTGLVRFHACVVDGVLEEVELLHWTTLEQPLVADRLQPTRVIPGVNSYDSFRPSAAAQPDKQVLGAERPQLIFSSLQ